MQMQFIHVSVKRGIETCMDERFWHPAGVRADALPVPGVSLRCHRAARDYSLATLRVGRRSKSLHCHTAAGGRTRAKIAGIRRRSRTRVNHANLSIATPAINRSFDPAGNRLLAASNGVPSVASYNALNQITSAAPGLTNSMTCLWDAENRLISVSNGTNAATFAYDGLGQRVQIVESQGGTITRIRWFVWSDGKICEEHDENGGVVKRFFPQGEQMYGNNYYYTRDQLGSVREMLDATGTVRFRNDYDPYGVATKIQGDLRSDFEYAGMYYHEASGLNLTLYRAYNPTLGRWLSRDRIEETGGINL